METDKRLIHRLTEYWNQLRGDYPLPQWKAFDTVSFDDVWQRCCGWSVDMEDETTIVYTYEHIGELVRQLAGKDMKGAQYKSPQAAPDAPPVKREIAASMVNDLLAVHFNNFPAARILQKIDRIVKRPGLVIEEGRADGVSGEEVRFRSCLLPFGNKAGKVTHMVLGLSWKTI